MHIPPKLHPDTLRGRPSAVANLLQGSTRGRLFCEPQNPYPVSNINPYPVGSCSQKPSGLMFQIPSSGLTRDVTRLKKFTWVPGSPLDLRAHRTNSGQPVLLTTNRGQGGL